MNIKKNDLPFDLISIRVFLGVLGVLGG